MANEVTDDEAEDQRTTGPARVIDDAARHGDARGALKLLDNGLAGFTDAPTADRVRALLYRAELAVRTGDRSTAAASLSEALSLDLTDDERSALANEMAHATELGQGVD